MVSTASYSFNSVDPKLEQLESVSNLVRHEFRTPLTSLQSVLKLLQHESYGYATANADELIKIAILATDRLTRLADALEEEPGLLHSMVSLQEMKSLQLRNSLSDGLKNEEFFLCFQPVFSVEENQIVGFEALSRWQHPTRGLVSPGNFIAIAETTGFIHELGLNLFQQACKTLYSWQQQLDTSRSLTMSINVSSVQLADPQFSNRIEATLNHHKISPDSLIFEITESGLINNLESALTTIHKLKGLGISLHLDDFGTGYSSLSRLQDFPFDAIKIDRSFVIQRNWNISKAILLLADSLQVNVIAEGIETYEQFQCLKDLGCNEMQGYYFSKPVSAEAAFQLLHRYRQSHSNNVCCF